MASEGIRIFRTASPRWACVPIYSYEVVLSQDHGLDRRTVVDSDLATRLGRLPVVSATGRNLPARPPPKSSRRRFPRPRGRVPTSTSLLRHRVWGRPRQWQLPAWPLKIQRQLSRLHLSRTGPPNPIGTGRQERRVRRPWVFRLRTFANRETSFLLASQPSPSPVTRGPLAGDSLPCTPCATFVSTDLFTLRPPRRSFPRPPQPYAETATPTSRLSVSASPTTVERSSRSSLSAGAPSVCTASSRPPLFRLQVCDITGRKAQSDPHAPALEWWRTRSRPPF